MPIPSISMSGAKLIGLAKAFLCAGLLCLSLPAALAKDEVTVGVYVNDIQNLDLKTHSYVMDAYIWFRWKNPDIDPSATFEFINSTESWGHTKTLDFEKPTKLPNGEYYQVVRVQGRFSRKLPLFDYPFDKQKLGMEFEDTAIEAKDFSYVADSSPVSINPDMQLPGFQIGKPELKISSKSYPTNFGDIRDKAPDSFSRIVVDIPIERSVLAYSVKLIFPIFCVIFCALLIFLLHPSRVDARVGIGITALLTIVALQMTMNEDLPEIDYLVLMDKVYLAGYLFVIACLTLVIRTARLQDRELCERAILIDRRSVLILAPIYILALVLILARII